MIASARIWVKGIVALHITVAALTCPVVAQRDAAAVVIVDKQTGQPLTGATVSSASGRAITASDINGNIHLAKNLLEKYDRLKITMTGYRTMLVSSADWLRLAVLELEPGFPSLEEVIVTANNPADRVKSLELGAETITAAEAGSIPAIFGETDLLKALQLKPGVKNAGEGLAGLFVRGGGMDQNLILLDGVPVYNPNHLMGLFSIFNNDAMRRVSLYKSSYPANYGGRLSSVIDISTRPASADSFLVSGGVGLLSSRLTLETPIKRNRSSAIVSARRTYFDVITRAINRSNSSKENYQHIPDYFFNDINLRADWKTGENSVLWVSGYLGKDHFHTVTDDYSASLAWGNRTASVNWKSTLRKNHEIQGAVFYSGYDYSIDNRQGMNNLEVNSSIQTVGFRLAGNSVAAKNFRIRSGLEGMIHRLTIGDYQSSSELSGVTTGEKASGNEWAAFASGEWDDGRRVGILGGIRISGFGTDKRFYLNPEPRIVTRLAIGEHSSIKASYTRMYQYLHLASLSSASLPVDMWYPSTERTKPQYADQLSLGWFRTLRRNTFYLSLEAYYKKMHNQVEFRDGANIYGNPRLEDEFVYGRGSAWGAETYLEKKAGRLRGWVGYTLSWCYRQFDAINGGEQFRPRYDRRHDLALVISYKLNNTFKISGNWVYGSGAYTTLPVGRFVFQNQVGRQPRSIIPVYQKRSNYQFPPMHRLDLGLVANLRSKAGTQEIMLSLYNVYSRRNPFFIQFKELSDKDGYVTAIQPKLVSLFPVLPGVTYNFRF